MRHAVNADGSHDPGEHPSPERRRCAGAGEPGAHRAVYRAANGRQDEQFDAPTCSVPSVFMAYRHPLQASGADLEGVDFRFQPRSV